MKKKILLGLVTLLAYSCDPVSDMEADISNTTSQNLSIRFVSSTFAEDTKTLEIESGETILFQQATSTTGSFLEPSLIQFDSIYIQDTSEEVLKIFKPDTPGKNIYDIDAFWNAREPSKRLYFYEYQITNEDIQ
nr:hypothetical protein [Allomuricauda sp.]